MDWEERIEGLWLDFMFWVRYYIFSLMLRRPDIAYVAARTLRNAADFAQAFSMLYGQEAGRQIEYFLTQHLILLAQIAATVNSGQDYKPLLEGWYQNAEELAQFLAQINPYWEKEYWLMLFKNRYAMEENLIRKLHEGDFETAVKQYDQAFANARQLIEYMNYGLTRHFQAAI